MGAAKSEIGPSPAERWQISLHTRPRQVLAIFLVLVTCGTLIYRTWWLFLAAWITRNDTSNPAVYEQAIRYDPNNADYHFVLAQIYNYSTPHLNFPRAGEEYEAAVRLNPHRWSHWLELSKYCEQQGNVERARYAMKMAIERDPYDAQTRWAAANFYVRMNDLKAADFELRRSADLDVSYLPQVLDLAWRVYADADRIMSAHVPNTKEADLTALNYFISQKDERAAALAWSKLKTFETRPQQRFGYVDYLVSLGKPHDAWNVFVFPAEPSLEPEAVFFNPSFEIEPMNGGFDWRFITSEHAEARRDTTTAKQGRASFLVTFDGKENLDYAELDHWLPVDRGRRYELSFWLKTEAISTNEGMFIEIDGHGSDKQAGTADWQQFTIPFTASADLVAARLRRIPSKKFDNLIKGKVWVDDFKLTAVR